MVEVCVKWRGESPTGWPGLDLKDLGALQDCQGAQFWPPSRNCPDDRTGHRRQFCQPLLRQFLPQAKLPHTLAEGGHNDSHKCGHRCAYKTYAVEGWFPGAGVLIEAVAKLGNLSLATMRIRQAVIHQ